jgi:hypothetical protein
MTRYAPQWLQSLTYPASVDRRLIGAVWPNPAVSGCAVSVASAMTVNVAPGQCAVPSANNTGSVLCTSDATETVTLTAAPGSGTNRIDLIVCQTRGNDLDGGANNDFLFTFVTGTPAATPVAPATPVGALVLAQVYVPGGSAAITAPNITDVRVTPLGVSNLPRGEVGFYRQTSDVGIPGSLSYLGIGADVPVAIVNRVYRAEFTFQLNAGAAGANPNLQIRQGALGSGGSHANIIQRWVWNMGASMVAGSYITAAFSGRYVATATGPTGFSVWGNTNVTTTIVQGGGAFTDLRIFES